MNFDANFDICIPSMNEIIDVMRIVARIMSKSFCVIKNKTDPPSKSDRCIDLCYAKAIINGYLELRTVIMDSLKEVHYL